MGPTEYNTADWGEFTEGWPWMVTNHGIHTADPWIARGLHADAMLQNKAYSAERLMLPGKPAWQAYWADRAYTQVFSVPAPGADGADGVFADNTTAGNWISWLDEGTTTEDLAQAYTNADGSAKADQWRTDVLSALKVAVPALSAKGAGLMPNYGGMGRKENHWDALDALPQPPVMALQEDGFVSPYGDTKDKVSFHSWDWDGKVREFARLKTTRAMMTSHGLNLVSPDDRTAALAQMDTKDPNGESGWDALWFSLGSFLLGFDDVRGNGYLYFTIWNGARMVYFDEFDPHHLHLGKAVAPFDVKDGVYVREFDDGWVVVNPQLFTNPTGMKTLKFAVPSGKARVVSHANLNGASSAALVTSVDVPPGKSFVLLKEGHAIDDSDNGPEAGDAGPRSDAAAEDGGSIAEDATPRAGDADAPNADAQGSGGCGCRTSGRSRSSAAFAIAVAALAVTSRRASSRSRSCRRRGR
jgi:hypothetical protein